MLVLEHDKINAYYLQKVTKILEIILRGILESFYVTITRIIRLETRK
jgi:hypothetical protein